MMESKAVFLAHMLHSRVTLEECWILFSDGFNPSTDSRHGMVLSILMCWFHICFFKVSTPIVGEMIQFDEHSLHV